MSFIGDGSDGEFRMDFTTLWIALLDGEAPPLNTSNGCSNSESFIDIDFLAEGSSSFTAELLIQSILFPRIAASLMRLVLGRNVIAQIDCD